MEERNYGIDILRIVSMVGVMSLHILGHGGVLDHTRILSINYNLAWLLEVIAYCAVDCFVLITGYVTIHTKYKPSNLFLLWLQTEIYSIVIMLIFFVFFNVHDIKECITAFLPVTTTQYWFFSMYFGMMLFVPIINGFIINLNKKNFLILLFITVIFTLFSVVDGNVFELNGGFSMLWFVILYLWGGALYKIQCVHKFDLKLIKYITIGMILLTWLSKIVLENITLRLMGKARYGLLFIKYTSPTILIIGCGLLIIFSNIKCNKIIPLLRKTTPLVFSAYLLQDNKYIRKYFITDKFSFLATKNTFIMMLGVLFFAIICFVVGILIDKVRLYLFTKIRLKTRIKFIEEKFFGNIIG